MDVYDILPGARSIYPKLAALTDGFPGIVFLVSPHKPIWLVMELVAFPNLRSGQALVPFSRHNRLYCKAHRRDPRTLSRVK
jgi:hypothetical protein